MATFKVAIVPTWSWLPDPRHMVVMRNGNYFRSLVAGTLSPLIHLPQMIWHLLLLPLLKGIVALVTIIIVNFVAGVLGFCSGVDVSVTDDKGQEIQSHKA